ncbi:hypothetical protein Godav_018686, partial [Gossypium davidsonii]|nr:hypothetical protein [Gossypium davidsonii]MBA0641144.1 hypothetical protein [Gossypium klotzschianum]
MERTLLSLCRPIQGAHIKPTGDSGIYVIKKFHHVGMKKMLWGGLWSFKTCLLLVHQLTKGDNPDDIYFRAVEFWIQAHDCLPGFVSKVLVRNLCNVMGSFLDVNEMSLL